MAITTTTTSDIPALNQAPLAEGMQAAAVRGLGGWAADRQGLGGRLSASSWALYGWTKRSPEYQRRQQRGIWGVLPYVSPPRRNTYGGIGKFLFALTKPGQGHNVIPGELTDTEASAVLTVPTPRGLNFARNGGVYLDEWGRLYPVDEAAITPRIETLGDTALQKAVA
jgi:hypothetical protein